MPAQTPHKPHLVHIEELDDIDVDSVPGELDEGTVPPLIEDDPEFDRLVEPDS